MCTWHEAAFVYGILFFFKHFRCVFSTDRTAHESFTWIVMHFVYCHIEPKSSRLIHLCTKFILIRNNYLVSHIKSVSRNDSFPWNWIVLAWRKCVCGRTVFARYSSMLHLELEYSGTFKTDWWLSRHFVNRCQFGYINDSNNSEWEMFGMKINRASNC